MDPYLNDIFLYTKTNSQLKKLTEVKKWIQCFQLVPAGADWKPWIHVTQYKP